ncbi:hypothetical protein B0H17DRAFT_1296284 [Mycena rosella]|uniref:C2H2-type domain-containing protein n=1 Tax=Mycena rosella TaxID=1033263 RepID=A0AAD7DEA5_MYCRO|nr:hypothetical protein B0H17DRAFT_1296284 [Mycena rosella]
MNKSTGPNRLFVLTPMPHRSSFTCTVCLKTCKSRPGLTQHHHAKHCKFTPASEDEDDNTFGSQYHLLLNVFLPPYIGPPPPPATPLDGQDPAAWEPFGERVDFDFAHFHFVEAQSSEKGINTALDIWAASVHKYGGKAPWKNAQELYAAIDSIQDGQAPWKTYKLRYSGPLPPGRPPKWMTQTYDLCTRDTRQLLHNQLETTAFKGHINMVPYRQFNHGGKRVWSNLMSGDWAWKQADVIAKDVQTHGTMLVPGVGGSDKTTVSIATSHQEFHPSYLSPGVLTGTVRRGHGNAVLPSSFLPIPKTSKKHRTTPAYQRFVRKMYHACLAKVFQPLKAAMTTPEVVKCPDGHFRQVIYSLGPYITDYPEQVWLTAIVQNWCPKCDAHPNALDEEGARLRSQTKTEFLITQFDLGILWDDFGIRSDVMPFTSDFPWADIYELISCDLLHQIIKGTFKDHLVSWVNDYLHLEHGEKRALEIIQDIDRRLSAVPEFPGLQCFPDGRDFKQWTGDNSKALMKIYLAAVAGYLPSDMIKCLSSFMDICYLLRRNSISTDDLVTIKNTLDRFHHYRDIFIRTGVRVDISLPRQHSLVHYIPFIQLFGSPNGLCSSITESKRIKAMKELWRHSSRFNALPQMLTTISRLDKMHAAMGSFCARGMMVGTTSSYTAMVHGGAQPQPTVAAIINGDDEDEDDVVTHGPKSLSLMELAHTAARGYPKELDALAVYIHQPRFPTVLRRFLYEEIHGPLPVGIVALTRCLVFRGTIDVHHSVIARFYAPSDLCGAGGMYSEQIRSNPHWHGHARRDTVLVDVDASVMRRLLIGRVLLFFSFTFSDTDYECMLVRWFVPVGDSPDPGTGMWVVQPEVKDDEPSLDVLKIDSVARAAHLIGVYGPTALPEHFHFSRTLDALIDIL